VRILLSDGNFKELQIAKGSMEIVFKCLAINRAMVEVARNGRIVLSSIRSETRTKLRSLE
jgi:hypothetical protein